MHDERRIRLKLPGYRALPTFRHSLGNDIAIEPADKSLQTQPSRPDAVRILAFERDAELRKCFADFGARAAEVLLVESLAAGEQRLVSRLFARMQLEPTQGGKPRRNFVG